MAQKPTTPADSAPARRRVHLAAFGCQMNKYDAARLADLLRARGWETAPDEREADAVLYLACSVRAHAEERVYSRLGALAALKRRRPELILGVLGCMAQKDGETVYERAPQVDLVVGAMELDRLPELLERALVEKQRQTALARRRFVAFDPAAPVSVPRSRAVFLTVLRGCDRACTYCVVPRCRGRAVSVPPAAVLAEARRYLAAGAVELTLLGQTVDAYGRDFDVGAGGAGEGGAADLAGLLRLLAPLERDGLRRLRFVTSHPDYLDKPLLRAMAELPVVMPFLHLPVQSGSDAVLERMRRGYTAAGFLAKVALARRLVPGIGIATDFIVGFPGETDAEFAATLELARAAAFQSAYVFKYSPRPKTWAATHLADDVPEKIKRERHAVLARLLGELALAQNRALVGSVQEVLVEGPSRRARQKHHDGTGEGGQAADAPVARQWSGRTPTNRIVVFEADRREALAGTLQRLRIVGASALTLFGEPGG